MWKYRERCGSVGKGRGSVRRDFEVEGEI